LGIIPPASILLAGDYVSPSIMVGLYKIPANPDPLRHSKGEYVMIRYSIAFNNIGIGGDLSLKSIISSLKFLFEGLINKKSPRIRIYIHRRGSK